MLLKRWEPSGDPRRIDSEFDRIWRSAFRPAHFRQPFGGYDGHIALGARPRNTVGECLGV